MSNEEQLKKAIRGGDTPQALSLLNSLNVNLMVNEASTLLMLATRKNNVAVVSAMLGFDNLEKDYASPSGTAFHIAAGGGFIEICKLFISFGLRIDVVNKWGFTPYDHAKQALSKAKDDAEKASNLKKVVELLRIATFVSAAKHGNIAVMDKMLEKDDVRAFQFIDGKRLFRYAEANGASKESLAFFEKYDSTHNMAAAVAALNGIAADARRREALAAQQEAAKQQHAIARAQASAELHRDVAASAATIVAGK